MAWPTRTHFNQLIFDASELLSDLVVLRNEIGLNRSLIDLEGTWHHLRIIVSEIHRPDGSVRYAYYVLDGRNHMIIGFDNSSDIQAIRLLYRNDWRNHLQEEIPHCHNNRGEVSLTEPMSFDLIFSWLKRNEPNP